MPIAIVLTLPFLFILIRRPVLRRLAFRNAVRRPRETALILLGSLLGTAIMTGSFIVGDTLDASIRRLAHTQLGPVDEVVSTPGLTGESETLENRLRPLSDNPNVDGVMPITVLGVSVATPDSDGTVRRAAPRSQLLEMDFDAARKFGDDPGATGISGSTPRPGHAVVGVDLARTLRVEPGDRVEVFAYGTSTLLEIDGVLPQRGLAGLWLTDVPDSRSRNIFVAPGTAADLYASSAATSPPTSGGEGIVAALAPDSIVIISNEGGVEQGAEQTGPVLKSIDQALDGADARIRPVKQDALELADEAGKSFTQLFTSMGMFGVLAGVLLLVNIFVMLAEERKSELGMLRAVGLRRSSLVGAFATEGWFYALSASALGTLTGFGLGKIIVSAAARVFDSGPEEFRIPLKFAATSSSIEMGFVAGFSIALATVVATSLRISRFNIIHAIRDIVEQGARAHKRRTLVFGALGIMAGVPLTVVGFTESNVFSVFVGPVFALVGLTPFLERRFSRRRVISSVAATVLAWSLGAAWITRTISDTADFNFFVVHGVVLTASAVTLFSQNQDVIGNVVRVFFRRSLGLRLGLAYPLARRFRTGMTLGMFSLVIFTLSLFTVFSAMFSNQREAFTRKISGSYDAIVRWNSASPVPIEEIESIEGVKGLSPLSTTVARFKVGNDAPEEWPISGFDESFVVNGPPELEDRGIYGSDAEAYRAVVASPDLILVDQFFLQRGGPPMSDYEPGMKLTLVDPFSGREREVTIAAIAAADMTGNGALYGLVGARELFGERLVPTGAYVSLRSGSNPVSFASRVAGSYVSNGARADSITALVEERLATQNQFFQLIRGYLALGLIVGVAGLGVVMVRAVRERRRQIGVLRALGFQASVVRRSFVVEAGFVSLEGVLIGVSLALLTAFNVVSASDFGDDFSFTVPWAELTVLMAGTTIAALLATAAPARSASKIRPAVALRITD